MAAKKKLEEMTAYAGKMRLQIHAKSLKQQRQLRNRAKAGSSEEHRAEDAVADRKKRR